MNNLVTMSKYSTNIHKLNYLRTIDDTPFKEKYTYTGQDLGLNYSVKQSIFKLWAPLAEKAFLYIYSSDQTQEKKKTLSMHLQDNGVWMYVLDGDNKGLYYTFETVYDKTSKGEFIDPYAHFAGINGKRAFIASFKELNTEEWENDQKPDFNKPSDAIIYEANIRDFTSSKNSGANNRGLFTSFIERGTVNDFKESTGLDHLVELGITHVQLMPVFDFIGIDDKKNDKEEYNWGYNPHNYNILKGAYSTNPHDPKQRVKEFRSLIEALHQVGLRCVMDVVYNHTAKTEDSFLNRQFPDYFYRHNSNGNFSNGSGCGNELATERPMVRKMILDSLLFWIKEYHIDGFRFDLMGLIDKDTVNLITREIKQIDSSILLYGEGWMGGTSPLPYEKQSLKNLAKNTPLMAYFNDDFRDCLKGHVFEAGQAGFTTGAEGLENKVRFALTGSINHPQVSEGYYSNSFWAQSPCQSINYVSAHDNLTLWDKILATNPNLSEKDQIRIHKLNLLALFTSMGIPFLHSGIEFLRTKKGCDNSYNQSESLNAIWWNNKHHFIDVFNYCKGLIEMRKTFDGFRMDKTLDIATNLSFIETDKAQTTAFIIENKESKGNFRKIAVYLNASSESVNLPLPLSEESDWMVVCDDMKAGPHPIRYSEDDFVTIPYRSGLVLVC